MPTDAVSISSGPRTKPIAGIELKASETNACGSLHPSQGRQRRKARPTQVDNKPGNHAEVCPKIGRPLFSGAAQNSNPAYKKEASREVVPSVVSKVADGRLGLPAPHTTKLEHFPTIRVHCDRVPVWSESALGSADFGFTPHVGFASAPLNQFLAVTECIFQIDIAVAAQIDCTR